MKAIKAIYNGIDKFNDFLGRIFSVLSLAILAVIMCEVIHTFPYTTLFRSRSSCAVFSTGRRSGLRT